jgi:FlaA1/EpsC-like NDP-sugar epimerase
MNYGDIEKVLARSDSPMDFEQELSELKNENPRILITGAKGSLGKKISSIFEIFELTVSTTDIDNCDVTNFDQVSQAVKTFKPSHILHLAADKHAPAGELNPLKTISINVQGTLNILNAINPSQTKIILASTCKACDPETVYGASKLIAERLVLNSGGSVARFFNVVDTAENVFEIWARIPKTEVIPVTKCFRYFISSNEAVSLLIITLIKSKHSPGRYIFDPGIPHFMPDVAQRLYPQRELKLVPPRRGDRLVEPLKANVEEISHLGSRLIQVQSTHDNKIIIS